MCFEPFVVVRDQRLAPDTGFVGIAVRRNTCPRARVVGRTTAGVGPALLWATQIGGQDVSFIAKWLHEFHAENRLEGDHVFVSFALDW